MENYWALEILLDISSLTRSINSRIFGMRDNPNKVIVAVPNSMGHEPVPSIIYTK